MKLTSFIIIGAILLSLIPASMLYTWLKTRLKPGGSLIGLIYFLLAVFALVFLYTFLLVFLIKLLFPRA